jgi:hydroxyethylthiazole kinase-like uncharacterized protein yjeF
MPRSLLDALPVHAAMPVHRSGEGFVSFVPDPRVMTVEELRSLDRAGVEEFGIPSAVLMENAALRSALLIAPLAADEPVVVFCGTGNNGGDGLALVRLLRTMGVRADGVLVGHPERLTPDAAMNLGALGGRDALARIIDRDADESSGVFAGCIGPAGAAVVVDALFGTGLSRPIEGAHRACVEALNASRASGGHRWTVSLDVPSGLDADGGEPMGVCVEADLTITFAGIKRGFGALGAQGVLGTLALVSIGVPSSLVSRFGEPLPESASGLPRASTRAAGARADPPFPAGRHASG